MRRSDTYTVKLDASSFYALLTAAGLFIAVGFRSGPA